MYLFYKLRASPFIYYFQNLVIANRLDDVIEIYQMPLIKHVSISKMGSRVNIA